MRTISAALHYGGLIFFGMTIQKLDMATKEASPTRGSQDLLPFLTLTLFFCVFGPEIACQVSKPPNSIKPNEIEFEI
jgi:hypothetical protein